MHHGVAIEQMSPKKACLMRRSLQWLVVISAFAVALSASIEASHLHLGKSQESLKNCSLCLSAHSSTSVAASAVQQTAPTLASSPLVLPRVIEKVSRLQVASLYIRPPPAV